MTEAVETIVRIVSGNTDAVLFSVIVALEVPCKLQRRIFENLG